METTFESLYDAAQFTFENAPRRLRVSVAIGHETAVTRIAGRNSFVESLADDKLNRLYFAAKDSARWDLLELLDREIANRTYRDY